MEMDADNQEMVKEIIDCISLYYPKGIDFFLHGVEYELSDEFACHRKKMAEAMKNGNWENLKGRMTNNQIDFFDFTSIPSWNSCYHFDTFLLKGYVGIFCISAFYPAYCYLIYNLETREAVWCETPPEVSGIADPFIKLISECFPGYVCLPKEILKTKIEDYSVQPYDHGEGRIFNYLFTYLSQYDHTL